jgi:hypothetical protein
MSEVQDIIPPNSRLIPGAKNYRADIHGAVWSRFSRAKGERRIGQWTEKKLSAYKSGYLYVCLSMDNGTVRRESVHALVLKTFVGPCPPGMEACHSPDRNPANNHLCNLRWDTHESNVADKFEHGTIAYGEDVRSAKLTEADIPAIFRLYRDGLNERQIGEIYNVTGGNIDLVLHRKSWGHVSVDEELLYVPRRGRGRVSHPNAKLKDSDIVEIFRRSKSGETQEAISRLFGVSPQRISKILLRTVWKHVTLPSDLLSP